MGGGRSMRAGRSGGRRFATGRTRNRLMHDGLSFTLDEAILRHAGQASSVTAVFQQLSDAQKSQLRAFLGRCDLTC